MGYSKKGIDVTKTTIVPTVVTYSKKGIVVTKKVSLTVYHALHRAIRAGYEEVTAAGSDEGNEDDEKEDEIPSLVGKILQIAKKTTKTIQRMVTAAISIPEMEEEGKEEDDDDDEDSGDAEENTNDDDDGVTNKIDEKEDDG